MCVYVFMCVSDGGGEYSEPSYRRNGDATTHDRTVVLHLVQLLRILVSPLEPANSLWTRSQSQRSRKQTRVGSAPLFEWLQIRTGVDH